MKRSLHVEEIRGYRVKDFDVEIVECKGKGHPDTQLILAKKLELF